MVSKGEAGKQRCRWKSAFGLPFLPFIDGHESLLIQVLTAQRVQLVSCGDATFCLGRFCCKEGCYCGMLLDFLSKAAL